MADTVGAILLTGITLYAVLGGADFGAGLWDLLAGGEQRGRPVRQLIDEAITPVWEANHVWLIFDLVVFWTAFPRAFAAVMTTVALPLWLALAGIVLRGSGFAFRDQIEQPMFKRAAGTAFALSSLVTPFFMGTVVGAVATGHIRADGARANVEAWSNPTAVLAGSLFVVACAYLAAVYLTRQAERRNDRRLRRYFALRARSAGVGAAALSVSLLAALHGSNHALYARLTGRALPLVIVAALCGLVTFTAISVAPARRLRDIAAIGVAAVIWGWGVAQYPHLLPATSVTLSNAGAPHDTLAALLVVFAAALVLVVPSGVLLFSLQERQVLQVRGTLWHPDGSEPGTSPRSVPADGPHPDTVLSSGAVARWRRRRST